MNKEVLLSIKFICDILKNSSTTTREGLFDLYEIQNGNKELLLKHLKVITNIMNRAIKELEGNNENTEN